MILLKEHKEVLLHYINTYPSRWKVKIREEWDNPFCVWSLRTLRNSYSPIWLDSLTKTKIEQAQIRQS